MPFALLVGNSGLFKQRDDDRWCLASSLLRRKETKWMRHYIRQLLLIFGCMLLMTPACMAEEDMRFVDARESTGYYVDADSVSVDSDHEYTADIAVVKADSNRRFVYKTHFDYNAMTYQILSSSVQTYDTKEVIGASDVPISARHYALGSPMKAIVDYIYAVQHGLKTD